MSAFEPDKVRNAIARDLREVQQLAVDLHWQATATPNDRDFPGGRALNMMAPAANLHDWQAAYDQLEEVEGERWAKRPKLDPAVYQDAAEEQPLNVLTFWTRIIREERDQPTYVRPTIAAEVNYLRNNLAWMTRTNVYGDPQWFEVTEVANDLRALVRSMEDVLSMGSRIDASASACFMDDASTETGRCGGRLVRVTLARRECQHVALARELMADEPEYTFNALGAILRHWPHLAAEHKRCDQGGRDDIYRCLKCEKKYTTTEYWLAVRENYERQAG